LHRISTRRTFRPAPWTTRRAVDKTCLSSLLGDLRGQPANTSANTYEAPKQGFQNQRKPIILLFSDPPAQARAPRPHRGHPAYATQRLQIDAKIGAGPAPFPRFLTMPAPRPRALWWHHGEWAWPPIRPSSTARGRLPASHREGCRTATNL